MRCSCSISGSAERNGGVGVMPAGMHHAGIKGAAGVRSIFLNRKSVNVCPESDGAADRIISLAGELCQNTSVGNHPVGDSPGIQAACDDAVSFKFLCAFFRMLVEGVTNGHKIPETVSQCRGTPLWPQNLLKNMSQRNS